ncbi:MAG: diacylglycerol/polyprenol kinase family protein [Candidatus Promineifilaceae bacterium]|jgi:phytol kinase
MHFSMNPLGANLWWVWDIIALLITFVVIQSLVLVNGQLQKRELLPTYITRKIIHIFAAPLFVLCWLLYSGSGASRYFAMVVPLAFIIQFGAIGLGIRKDEAFVNSMSRSGNPRELLGGTMHYAIIMLICTILFFNAGGAAGNNNPTALYILGALAGGDGLADILGRRFGGDSTFGFGGSQKTIIGSVGMFLGSFIMILVLTAVFGTGLILPTIIILSLFATIVEAISPKGFDNYTIPIAVFVGIVILSLVAPGLWPYTPLFTL